MRTLIPAPASAAQVALMSAAMGCRQKEARRVWHACVRANRALQRDADRLARPDARLPELSWPGADSFGAAVAADGRPLILATLHLGNYLSHLLALAPHMPWLGQVVALRRTEPHASEQGLLQHFARRGLKVTLVRSGGRPARTALRALASGHHVLLLYDVPPAFDVGRTHHVDWLGRPGQLPAGPAMLARASGALLWPLCFRPDERGTLQLRHANPLVVEDPEQATRRLAGLGQRWILEQPRSWLLWGHLHDFWGLRTISEKGLARP